MRGFFSLMGSSIGLAKIALFLVNVLIDDLMSLFAPQFEPQTAISSSDFLLGAPMALLDILHQLPEIQQALMGKNSLALLSMF